MNVEYLHPAVWRQCSDLVKTILTFPIGDWSRQVDGGLEVAVAARKWQCPKTSVYIQATKFPRPYWSSSIITQTMISPKPNQVFFVPGASSTLTRALKGTDKWSIKSGNASMCCCCCHLIWRTCWATIQSFQVRCVAADMAPKEWAEHWWLTYTIMVKRMLSFYCSKRSMPCECNGRFIDSSSDDGDERETELMK